MNKTEMLKQSALHKNATQLTNLGQQIEALRHAKYQSVEALAAMLEPLAHAMASLTDETRQTLAEIERKSQEKGDEFRDKIQHTTRAWLDAAQAANQAAIALDRAVNRMAWRHYALALMTGLITAVLVSGLWLWLVPPTIENRLDPEQVAKHLKSALTQALKPSKRK